MSKLKRYYEEGQIYFVTSNTYSRKPFFEEEDKAGFLLNILRYYKSIFCFKIFAYCIMPDHIHLVIQPAKCVDLSKIMKHIKGNFAVNLDGRMKKNGKVWQHNFYDVIIRDEQELAGKINYIHNNAVSKELVRCAEDYPYSSAKVYIKDEKDYLADKYIS
ncbi:MAG: transposase [Candidatus Omnitrophica bacterium]|nr:transposase [Candidatus Omnitrophota bacterium]